MSQTWMRVVRMSHCFTHPADASPSREKSWAAAGLVVGSNPRSLSSMLVNTANVFLPPSPARYRCSGWTALVGAAPQGAFKCTGRSRKKFEWWFLCFHSSFFSFFCAFRVKFIFTVTCRRKWGKEKPSEMAIFVTPERSVFVGLGPSEATFRGCPEGKSYFIRRNDYWIALKAWAASR